MMDIMSFDEQARFEHNLRIKEQEQENRNKQMKDFLGEGIYRQFCLWCNCQGKPMLRNSMYVFGEWLQSEGIELGFWQRKYIGETYFELKFTFDPNKNKWKIERRI